jgi:hypothetical protein
MFIGGLEPERCQKCPYEEKCRKEIDDVQRKI